MSTTLRSVLPDSDLMEDSYELVKDAIYNLEEVVRRDIEGDFVHSCQCEALAKELESIRYRLELTIKLEKQRGKT